LAGDAALFAVRITAQRMLAAEAGRGRRLLVRIVDRRLGLEEILQLQGVRLDEFPQREGLDGARDHDSTSMPRRPMKPPRPTCEHTHPCTSEPWHRPGRSVRWLQPICLTSAGSRRACNIAPTVLP